MSDTPRTDFVAHAKAWANGAKDKIVQLERELAAAIASFSEERERAQREGARVIKLQGELAEAQAEIVRLKGEAQYGATFIKRAIDAERELSEAKEQLRLCNVDQFTTAAELAEAKRNYMDFDGGYAEGFSRYLERELAKAIAKERERCALVCEEFYSVENIAQKCAAAIRKGGMI